MTHRVEQVVQAIASTIATAVEPEGINVYTHRRLSLAGGEDELPGISVDYGDLDPVGEENNLTIDGYLTVLITAVFESDDEAEVRVQLTELQAKAHVAINADETLGLGFVFTTTWAGWEAPEFATDGESIIGRLTAPWVVHLRMNHGNPSS